MSTLLPVLRESVARVESRLDARPGSLPDVGALREELASVAALVHAKVTGEADGNGASEPRPSLLGLRMIDVLRAEVLRSWPETDGARGDGPGLLPLMRAFEEAAGTIAPNGSDVLGSPALDPWARELLGEVAHTLGSSFSSIVFLTEALATGMSGPLNDLQRAQVRIVHRAALTAGSAGGDILRLSGPIEEPRDGSLEPASLHALLTEVAHVLEPIAQEKEFDIRVEAPADPDPVDRAMLLRRILLSLSLAAVNRVDGGTLTLEAQPLSGGSVRFAVLTTPDSGGDGGSPVVPTFSPRPTGQGWSMSLPGLGIAAARVLLRAVGSELRVEEPAPGSHRLAFVVDGPQP